MWLYLKEFHGSYLRQEIPPEKLAHIFEMTTRLSAEGARSQISLLAHYHSFVTRNKAWRKPQVCPSFGQFRLPPGRSDVHTANPSYTAYRAYHINPGFLLNLPQTFISFIAIQNKKFGSICPPPHTPLARTLTLSEMEGQHWTPFPQTLHPIYTSIEYMRLSMIYPTFR